MRRYGVDMAFGRRAKRRNGFATAILAVMTSANVREPVSAQTLFSGQEPRVLEPSARRMGGAMLLRAMSGLANEQPLSFLVLVLIATITGFSISLVLAVIYRQLIAQRPLVTWGVTACVLIVAAALGAFIDAWVISLYRTDGWRALPSCSSACSISTATLLGAWSALYYAINFFLQVEEQNDQLMRLENQATARSWPCCAISSTRISCSTRSIRSPRWCCSSRPSPPTRCSAACPRSCAIP
jgi:hypothetical protein